MKYLYLTIYWVLGAILLLTGFISLVKLPLAGLCFIAMSFFLLPPIRSFLHSKTNKTLTIKAKSISILVLLVLVGYLGGVDQRRTAEKLEAQKQQELAEHYAQVRQEIIADFNSNREEILSSAKKHLEAKEYQLVISSSEKYLVSGDKELSEVHATAKSKLIEVQIIKKTENLLAKLKSIPSTEYEKNNDLYKQLLAIHPTSEKYKNKIKHYSKKIKDEQRKQAVAKARKETLKKQFSSWDGSHRNLENIIKKAMNDPDSYEHDETVYWDMDDYIVVKTTYRGRNAFGGIVRNFVKAKISLDGQVLQILDET